MELWMFISIILFFLVFYSIDYDYVDPTPDPTLSSTTASYSSIVKEWSPQVAFIYCEWIENGRNVAATGSGFLTVDPSGIVYILTNKHVLFDDDTYAPTHCNALLLNGTSETVQYDPNTIVMKENYDMGQMRVSNALGKNIQVSNFCPKDVEIGDPIVILGYPGIGSNKGITATQGIISGIEKDFYITDAKIDHGNSGGIAVSVKDDCIVGMPSSAISGSVESLGRILKSSVILR